MLPERRRPRSLFLQRVGESKRARLVAQDGLVIAANVSSLLQRAGKIALEDVQVINLSDDGRHVPARHVVAVAHARLEWTDDAAGGVDAPIAIHATNQMTSTGQ